MRDTANISEGVSTRDVSTSPIRPKMPEGDGRVIAPKLDDPVTQGPVPATRIAAGDNTQLNWDALRRVYADQLRWYHGFDHALQHDTSPAACYGMLSFTHAINDTIRDLKRAAGFAVHEEPVRLPWRTQDSTKL